MKENQGLKEGNKGLDCLVSFIDMYLPVMHQWLNIVLFLNVFFYGVDENA